MAIDGKIQAEISHPQHMEDLPIQIVIPSELIPEVTKYCLKQNLTTVDRDGNIEPNIGDGVIALLRDVYSDETKALMGAGFVMQLRQGMLRSKQRQKADDANETAI